VPVEISSPVNPKVRRLRSLHRRRVRHRERLFLVEGVRLTAEAVAAGFTLQLALYVPEQLERTPRGAELLAHLAGSEEAFPTTDSILKAVADTATPQGVVAAVPFPELPPRPGDLTLVLDRVRDPGNCGAILRTAEAAAVGVAYCAPGTVDPFSPKVIRAGMGAHFRLPLRVLAHWDEVASLLAGQGQILLAEVGGERSYDEVDWRGLTALIVGGEAEGAGSGARDLATATVSIPMAGPAESLNVAVATGILLFEALRQRRLPAGSE
jgi:TrmH family RNA methyltransferase